MSKEWIDMSDKVVIVTGGSMGIGSHIVEALLKNHAKVVIADMADCDAYDDNENVMYVKCNVTKKEEVEEMVNKTVEKFGKLDCLVNNAGVNRPRMLVDYYHSDPNHENSEDDFDFMMGVNVKGVMFCAQAAARIMIKQKSGVILNMSSEAGMEGSKGQNIYSATKGAVNSFTLSWAKELGAYNVRVVAVAPGINEPTPMGNPEHVKELAYTRGQEAGSVSTDILTNDNLSEMVDTSDEWIRTRTGICNRHIAKDMDNADMAYNAARNAVEDARIEASKIGLIIVATSTPDYAFPNQASLVQAKLKAVNAMCFDVSAACSGFITALDIAASMLKAGSYKYALVIGSEKMSEIVNWKDRSVCVLFGDGAGAVVLKAVDNNTEDVTGALVGHERGIIDSNIYNDGTGASVLTGGRRFSDSCSTDIFIHMDGQEVFKFAVKSVPTAIETLLHNNNMDINEVDKFILHQANVRIIESVAKRLKADKDKFPVNLNEYGNTSSASIPILLDELNRNGSLKQGEKLVLAGFGAGLSWGSILLVW